MASPTDDTRKSKSDETTIDVATATALKSTPFIWTTCKETQGPIDEIPHPILRRRREPAKFPIGGARDHPKAGDCWPPVMSSFLDLLFSHPG